MSDELHQSHRAGEPAAPNPLAGAMRFLRAVRFRLRLVVWSVVVCALFGGMYYSTATRLFQSSAALLVLQTGGVMDEQGGGDREVQARMPTFQKLVTSEAVLNAALKEIPPEHRGDLRGLPQDKWVQAIRGSTSVSLARSTNLIEINYRSKSADSAAVVLDHIVAAYLDFLHETHRNGARELIDVLTTEKVELEKKLLEKEQELVQLRSRSELLLTGGASGQTILASRVVQLNDALVLAQRKTLECRTFYSAVEEAVEKGEDLQQFAFQELEFLGREIMMRELGLATTDAFALARVQEQIINDRAALQARLDTLGPNHPVVTQLRERIAITERLLAEREQEAAQTAKKLQQGDLGPRLVQIARHKLLQAEAQEQSIREQFDEEKKAALQQNGLIATLEILDLDVKRMRSFYELLLERIKNVDLGKDHGVRTAIVTEPRVVSQPVSPKLKVVALACLLGGLALGCAAVYVVDTLDDRFRGPEELTLQLGLPVLSCIPPIEPTGGEGVDAVITLAQPNSVESEAFRSLRTAISFSGGETRRLAITSSEPSDGKTTVSTNLAAAFSQTGKRTLLIDADMRRPGATGLLQLRGAAGLSAILRDRRPVEESVVQNLYVDMAPGLDVIPAGSRPANPAELLGSDRFQELLAWAEGEYDQVLVDTPPVLAVTDMGVVSRIIDGVLLVVQPKKNHRRTVQRSVEALRMLNANVLGIVANNVGGDRDGYYGYGYGYGNGYGYGDGHDDPPADSPEHAGSGHDGDDADFDGRADDDRPDEPTIPFPRPRTERRRRAA